MLRLWPIRRATRAQSFTGIALTSRSSPISFHQMFCRKNLVVLIMERLHRTCSTDCSNLFRNNLLQFLSNRKRQRLAPSRRWSRWSSSSSTKSLFTPKKWQELWQELWEVNLSSESNKASTGQVWASVALVYKWPWCVSDLQRKANGRHHVEDQFLEIPLKLSRIGKDEVESNQNGGWLGWLGWLRMTMIQKERAQRGAERT